MQLRNVAVTAEVAEDGKLGGVNAFREKLQVARRGSNTLVASVAHQGDVPEAFVPCGDGLYQLNDFFIVLAEDLQGAERRLALANQARGFAPVDHDVINRHTELAGRETEQADFEQYVQNLNEVGYYLLLGRMGAGKTAFVVDQWRRRELCITHFLRSKETLSDVFRRLEIKLKMNFPEKLLPDGSNPARRFVSALTRIGSHYELAGDLHSRLVILLDAKEYPNCLNEILRELPARLPPRVKVLVSTREEPQVRNLTWSRQHTLAPEHAGPPDEQIRTEWNRLLEECERESESIDHSIASAAVAFAATAAATEELRPTFPELRIMLELASAAVEGAPPVRVCGRTPAEVAAHIEAVLRLAKRHAFFTIGDQQSWNEEFLLKELSSDDLTACHHWFALAARKWSSEAGNVNKYLVRNRMFHCSNSDSWRETALMFVDADFVSQQGAEAFTDMLWQTRNLKHTESEDLDYITIWERFLRRRFERLRNHPDAYPQELANELRPAVASSHFVSETLSAYPDTVPLVRTTPKDPFQSDGHVREVEGLVVAPSGRWLASYDVSGAVKIWDLAGNEDSETKEMVADWTVKVQNHRPPQVTFHPHSRRVATGDYAGSVAVWETHSGMLITSNDEELSPHEIHALAFHPEEHDFLLAGNQDGLAVYRVERKETCDLEYVAAGISVHSLAIAPDGKTVAAGLSGGEIAIWNWAPRNGSARLKFRKKIVRHTDNVRLLKFVDEQRFVSGTGNDAVLALTNIDGDCLNESASLQQRHKAVNDFVIADEEVYCLTPDEVVRWPLAAGELPEPMRIERVNAHRAFRGLALSRDRGLLAATQVIGDPGVHVWDTAKRDAEPTAVRFPQASRMTCIAFNQDVLLAGGSSVEAINLGDGTQARICAPFPQAKCAAASQGGIWVTQQREPDVSRLVVHALSENGGPDKESRLELPCEDAVWLSPDGRHVANAQLTSVVIQDVQSTESTTVEVGTFVEQLALANGGERFAIIDKTWTPAAYEGSGQISLPGFDNRQANLVTSASDKQFLLADDDELTLVNVVSGAVEWTVKVPNAVSIAHHEKGMLAAATNGAVLLFRGGEKYPLPWDHHVLSRLTFSPDGTLLAAICAEQRLLVVWDLERSRKLPPVLFGHPPSVVVFGRDSQSLVVVDRRGEAKKYRIRRN